MVFRAMAVAITVAITAPLRPKSNSLCISKFNLSFAPAQVCRLERIVRHKHPTRWESA